MNFLQSLQTWAKGDMQQGRWMIGLAIVILLPFIVFLFKNNQSLQKGIALPICLLLLVSIGYGGYVWYSRAQHISHAEKQFQRSPKQTFDVEVQKIKADDKSFSALKYAWGAGIIFFVALYFFLSKDYYKGLSLGFALLFFGFLLIDSFFHQRLKVYLETLQKILD